MDNVTFDSAYYYYLKGLNEPWYAVAGWFCPIVAFITIVVNIINLIILPKVPGISRTARIYYIALAILDLASAIAMDLFNYFFAQGIEYISGLVIRWDLVLQTELGGGIIYFVQDGVLSTLNWVYLIFTSERLAIILWPIKMRSFMKTKYAYISLAITSVACWSVSITHIWSSTTANFYGIQVQSIGSSGLAAFFAAYYIPIGNFCCLPLLNLLILVVMVLKLRSENRNRATLQQRVSASKSADSTTVTLISMALTHCLLFASYGISMAFTVALANSSALVQQKLLTWAALQNEFLQIDNCLSFFFYVSLMKPYKNELIRKFACNS